MGLLERITKNIDNKPWYPEDDLFPVKNRYTAGVAGQRFFEELKENGKIYGSKCEKCNLVFVPAKLFCERCFARLEEWVDVGPRGTVYAFTLAYKNKDGSKKEKPSLIAAVKIADSLLIHWLGECDAAQVKIGMEVEAVLKDKGERTGGLLDIKYFKPV